MTEILHVEKITTIRIYRRLMNIYGDQSVDVSTVKRWIMRLSVTTLICVKKVGRLRFCVFFYEHMIQAHVHRW